MKSYLKNWNYMRLLRLALGIFIIIQGISVSDWMVVAMGSLLSLMPVFNIGCCGVTGCHTTSTENKKSINEISFEEVK